MLFLPSMDLFLTHQAKKFKQYTINLSRSLFLPNAATFLLTQRQTVLLALDYRGLDFSNPILLPLYTPTPLCHNPLNLFYRTKQSLLLIFQLLELAPLMKRYFLIRLLPMLDKLSAVLERLDLFGHTQITIHIIYIIDVLAITRCRS